ncbi:MAG: hypothetical protein KGL39_37075 [Patescibacteria group bacterium]|nr:hypothetical protein [Patescibacteria group bacterium]
MSFGPVCERCGGNYCGGPFQGSMDTVSPICPWCHKPKKRGSREELVKLLHDSKHAMIAAVGFLSGASVSSKEAITAWLVGVVKEIEEA